MKGSRWFFQCRRERRWMILETKGKWNEAWLRNEGGEIATKRTNKESHDWTLFNEKIRSAKQGRRTKMSVSNGKHRKNLLKVREKIWNNDHSLKGPFLTTYALEVSKNALGELELLIQWTKSVVGHTGLAHCTIMILWKKSRVFDCWGINREGIQIYRFGDFTHSFRISLGYYGYFFNFTIKGTPEKTKVAHTFVNCYWPGSSHPTHRKTSMPYLIFLRHSLDQLKPYLRKRKMYRKEKEKERS